MRVMQRLHTRQKVFILLPYFPLKDFMQGLVHHPPYD